MPDDHTRSARPSNRNGPPPPPPPPPPPRGLAPTPNIGTIRRTSSDFVEQPYVDRRNDHYNDGALDYDHNFESRFRFTPIDHLPLPERWNPPSTHTRSSRQHVNVR